MNAMPRLLILEALTDIAGGQSVLIDVLPALISTYQVGAIVPGDGALQRALQASDVVVFHAPMADYQLIKKSRADWLRFVVETPRLALTALRLIGQFNADLVYGNNSRTLVWGTLAASLARRPMMWHIHNIFGDRKTLRLLAVMSQLGAVKRIVCASTQAASQFKAAGTTASKLSVLPNGVDLTRFAPSPTARDGMRTQYHIDSGAPLAGIVGDLIPLKGQLTFIEAARAVHARIPAARFWIIGQARPAEESREYAATVQARADGLPVDFIGFQSDMPAVLNALDVLVIASTTETGPLVLLEALACGVPVLSTPVGRAAELLPDGGCGELFPIGDPDTLAIKMIAMLSNSGRRTAMGCAARERAVGQLSLETFRARLLGEIASVVLL